MSITGKGTLSLRRKDVAEQKSIAIGFKDLFFAHTATLGDTGLDLTSLTPPGNTFGTASSSEILAANLFAYRKNLRLVSSVNGVLMDFQDYEVSSSSRINFVGFTAAAGEIFYGYVSGVARNGIQMVDAAPLVSTGELAIAATDFNVGQMFEINKYSSAQVGAVVVYRNGVQQFRNTGNSSTVLDGNYYEVNNGSGTGQIIRFNVAPVAQADSILVVSNGLMAYNPDGSALQRIEAISGKIDSMVPTVAALAGVPESTFGGVTNVDLKSFGDTVLTHESRLDALENPVKVCARAIQTSGQSITTATETTVVWDSKINDTYNCVDLATGIVTAPKNGSFRLSGVLGLSGIASIAGIWYVAITLNGTSNVIFVNRLDVTPNVNGSISLVYNAEYPMSQNDTLRVRIYQSSGSSKSLIAGTNFANVLQFSEI